MQVSITNSRLRFVLNLLLRKHGTFSSVISKVKVGVLLQQLSTGPIRTRRTKRACRISGRARGVTKFFGISRFVAKQLAEETNLPGVLKASW